MNNEYNIKGQVSPILKLPVEANRFGHLLYKQAKDKKRFSDNTFASRNSPLVVKFEG